MSGADRWRASRSIAADTGLARSVGAEVDWGRLCSLWGCGDAGAGAGDGDGNGDGPEFGEYDSRWTVWTRVGSAFEWVGLGQSRLGVDDVVLASVKLSDLGDSGGLALGLDADADDGGLVEAPSARGDGLRGA